MNAIQVHLALNHTPIIGSFVAAMVLAVAWWRRSQPLLRVGLWGLVLTALVAIPVYFTGEPAAEIVEKLPAVSKHVVETHEDFAKIAFVGLELLGGIGFLALLRYRTRAVPAAWNALVLILAIVASLAVVWVGHLGGQIRHTELRTDLATQANESLEER